MSELNFPTKLIRLTKATLTIVMCCVKIQNDCSESFEIVGLRQEDVLSTLLFNVVLEVIVRRANLQTNGTIYNKETQLLETVDHLIWYCERFRLERHRLIGAIAALNVSFGIPIRNLCALKKWCAVKCCLDFLRELGIKL
jgi:hypothetical protein